MIRRVREPQRAEQGELPAKQTSKITLERVVTVLPRGYVLANGAVLSATGEVALVAGQEVPVAWREGKPIAIVLHSARRVKFAPPLPIAGAPLVEELIMLNDDDRSIYFRNDAQLTRLKNVVSPTGFGSSNFLRWGFKSDRFQVFDNWGARDSFNVYKIKRSRSDGPLESRTAKAEFVQQIIGFADGAPFVTLHISTTSFTAVWICTCTDFGVSPPVVVSVTTFTRTFQDFPDQNIPVGLNTSITVPSQGAGPALNVLSSVKDVWIAPNGDMIARVRVEANHYSLWWQEYLVNTRTRQVLFTTAPVSARAGSTTLGPFVPSCAQFPPPTSIVCGTGGAVFFWPATTTVVPSVSTSINVGAIVSGGNQSQGVIRQVYDVNQDGSRALAVAFRLDSAVRGFGLLIDEQFVPQGAFSFGFPNEQNAVTLSADAHRALWYLEDPFFGTATSPLRMAQNVEGVLTIADVGTDPTQCLMPEPVIEPESPGFRGFGREVAQFLCLRPDFLYAPREKAQKFYRAQGTKEGVKNSIIFDQQNPQPDGAMIRFGLLKKLSKEFPVLFMSGVFPSDGQLRSVSVHVLNDRETLVPIGRFEKE